MYKEKTNKIFNNNLPIFSLFCLIWIIYLGFIVNYWYLLFFILLPLFLIKIKPNKWQIIILFIIFFPIVLIMFFLPNFSLIEIFNNWFNSVTNGGPSKWLEIFLNHFYDNETTSFIKLILLNIKSKETYIFLKQTIDLGIVWLISSAGFHLSLIARIIDKIFKKKQLAGFITNIVLLTIYTFFLGFAYGCLRVLIKKCLKVVFVRNKINQKNQLGLVGLSICLFNPSCFVSYSFSLSFLICIGSYFIIDMKFNNKILSTILMNFISFIITIPFIVNMNHKISILTFINSFVFTYYFVFIFLYFLIFAWMPFMSIIHYGIIRLSYILVGNISFSNIYIWSNPWPEWAQISYFLILFSLQKIIYLIVINNKI